jgi:hypothetical protein
LTARISIHTFVEQLLNEGASEMTTLPLRRLTRAFGVATFGLSLVSIPLYFVYDGPPPVSNVLARSLLDVLTVAALVGFLVGLRQLLRDARPDAEWLANLFLALGLVYATTSFVATSIQVGAVLGTDGSLDPTTIGGHGEGSILLFGPLARLLTAGCLAAAAAAVLRSGVLPRWTARAAQGVALFHLAMVPSLFAGTRPADFYSVNGWNIPVAASLFLAWVLAASLAVARERT